MAYELQPIRGKVSGVGQVICGKTGKVKSTFNFEGETPLSEEELRKELGLAPCSDSESKQEETK